MERILARVKDISDQAEIYSVSEDCISADFQNGKLKEIGIKKNEGISLRIIRKGKCGFSYTTTPRNSDTLIKRALESLENGKDAEFDLPLPVEIGKPKTYDPSIYRIDERFLVEEGKKLIMRVKAHKSDMVVDCHAGKSLGCVRIMNTNGVNYEQHFSTYYICPMLRVENSGGSIYTVKIGNVYVAIEDSDLEEIISLHNHTENTVPVPTGRMQALFQNSSLDSLIWRFREAVKGSSLYYGLSPLKGKERERIASEKFSYYDNPMLKNYCFARAFDDEGIPTQKTPLIERGVLKNFVFDCDMGKKCGVKSTGNGYREARLAEPISSLPVSAVRVNYVEPGETSFKEMISMMDEGIIVNALLGGHSGNIMNGDFSCSVGIGFYVKGGKILGRTGDSMVAGNVYEVFRNIEAVEDRVHYREKVYPGILFGDVSFAGK